jgi:hypothetical protein
MSVFTFLLFKKKDTVLPLSEYRDAATDNAS